MNIAPSIMGLGKWGQGGATALEVAGGAWPNPFSQVKRTTGVGDAEWPGTKGHRTPSIADSYVGSTRPPPQTWRRLLPFHSLESHTIVGKGSGPSVPNVTGLDNFLHPVREFRGGFSFIRKAE